MKQRGKHKTAPSPLATSPMCKYFCANAAFEVVDSAMQVLGGVGIAGNHRISRFWRDLRVDRVSGGSDEMQILTLGRAVLKQYR
ncbi:acyl-CoA dehydrogenase family protein [Shigella flexneri]